MYYLQSRYYDAKICRFINADGYVSTGQGLTGYNMYSYCGNNPVNRVDSTGDIWRLVLAIVVVAGVLMLTGCSQQESTKDKKQNAKDAAEKAEIIGRKDDESEDKYLTVDIQIDTKYVMDSVDLFAYGYYYDALYERYLAEAKALGVSEDELMTKKHIRWELQVHMIGQILNHSSANPANLNREETWCTILRRLFK